MSYTPEEKDKQLFASEEKIDNVGTLEAGNYGQSDLNAFGQHRGEELKHALLPRHVAMISIGGVIGTGLFLGTGSALHHAGPLGLLLGYAVIGSVCYAMMQCLGEMIAQYPVPGGHVKVSPTTRKRCQAERANQSPIGVRSLFNSLPRGLSAGPSHSQSDTTTSSIGSSSFLQNSRPPPY